MGDIEIFLNFLNWALPALGVLAFMVGIPVLIIWTIFVGRKKYNGMQLLKKILIFGLAFIGIFVIYGFIQLVGAMFGIDTNRATTIEQNTVSNS